MEIIGSKVTSKATGAVGTITGLLKNKIMVNYIVDCSIPCSLDLLDMDEELRSKIELSMKELRSRKKA